MTGKLLNYNIKCPHSLNLSHFVLLSSWTFQPTPLTRICCVWSSLSYPVILSIENHCSVPQQKKMAQYLIEILGDKLDLSNIKADESGWLPSPETLKGKILVKVKSQFKMWLILFGERSQSSSNYLSSQILGSRFWSAQCRFQRLVEVMCLKKVMFGWKTKPN